MWDLQRAIERNHADNREDILDLKAQLTDTKSTITAQLERFVLREVYEAQMAAMRERVSRLEDETKAARAAVRGAVYAALASVVASIVAGIVLAVLFRGGK